MRLRFLLARAAPYRTALLGVSALSLLGSAALLAVPWLAGRLLGGVVVAEAVGFEQVALLLVGMLTLTTVLTIAAGLVSARVSGRILADLRRDVYAHLQALPMRFHDYSRHGDLVALLSYEVTNLSQFLSSTLAGVPAMVLTAAGSLVLLFLIDPVVALALPLALPVFYIALKIAGRRLRDLSAKAREAEAELMAVIEEDLDMLPATKSFAVEGVLRGRYAVQVERAFGLGLRQERIGVAIAPLATLGAGLAAIALLLVAGPRVASTGEDPGELFSLLLYAALLTRPIGGLADLYGRLQWARGTLARLEAVLGEPVEPGLAGGETIERANGAIAFEGVCFAYPGREAVLRGLDLRIEAGEILAVIGRNGAGKSTLISLLMALYRPDSGRILLDGMDIAALQVQALRRQIGYVPQRALLFNGTIRENIAFGVPDASDEQILAAARLAQAEKFLVSLPEGLATRVGDHGVRLSGGQRQRIALARALLPDPPILVFDEATAMYDIESEAAFVATCRDALAGRTVIIVTHRPASLALADRIVAIEDGVARPVEARG